MLARIVRDGRIVVQRNDTRAVAAFNESAGGTHGRGRGSETIAKRVGRRGLQGFPFLASGCGQHWAGSIPRGLRGEDTVFEI